MADSEWVRRKLICEHCARTRQGPRNPGVTYRPLKSKTPCLWCGGKLKVKVIT